MGGRPAIRVAALARLMKRTIRQQKDVRSVGERNGSAMFIQRGVAIEWNTQKLKPSSRINVVLMETRGKFAMNAHDKAIHVKDAEGGVIF